MTIKKYKNKHSGERVFLIGNGPSLENTPLELLNDEYSIAMSKITGIFNKTKWRPTYYLQSNIGPYSEERVDRISSVVDGGITSFVSMRAKDQLEDKIRNKDKIEFINSVYKKNKPIEELDSVNDGNYQHIWSNDISKKICHWETIMYAATQLAAYMGFKKIYFVGCDLYNIFKPLPYSIFPNGSDPVNYIRLEKNKQLYYDFIFENSSPIRSIINGIWFKFIYRTKMIGILHYLYKSTGNQPKTHFSNGKVKKSRFYEPGTNQGLISIHKIISLIGEHEGFECYNATKGGQLDVHERVDLLELFNT